jgi:hypothetical protein
MAGVKKNRCTFKECQLTAQRIVGDCGFCQGHFCSKHRLLEDHKCEGLEDVGTPHDLDCLSTSASSTSTSSTQSSPTASRGPRWWLVGLSDLLASDDMDMADVADPSARSSRTSGTPPSSRTSGPRSSRVFDENYDDDDEAAGGDAPMGGV